MIYATVITDASFSDVDMSAGWAAWVRIDGIEYPIKHYSSFKGEKPRTSIQAEKMAAINGAWIAKKHGAEIALIQSDCMGVIHMINGTTRKLHLISQWNIWIEKAGLVGFPMRGKHVRGHTKRKDARSYVNRWCDEMAGKARKNDT